MKLNYRYDDGLEFLQYCSNEELNFFVELFTKEASTTETLTSEQKYRKNFPKHSKYWKLIVAELQYFGGNTFLNILRGRGVLYKEILCNVCEKEYINYDKNADVSQIEKSFIYTYLKKSISEMNIADRNLFRNNFKLIEIDELKLFNEIRKKIFVDDAFFQNITTNLTNSLGKNILKQGVKVVLPIVAQQLLKKTLSLPIGIALTVKDISDPAFRITLPSVFYISYLRNKYKEQDSQFRHLFYPKKGSIVRVELVGNLADHSGIYIGNGKIIEIMEDNNKGCVQITDLYDFVYSSSMRTGISIYVAVDKLSKDVIYDEHLVENAKKYLGKKNEYRLLKNNCHSFVYKCIINENFDKITSTWKFEHLTKMIEKYMNNGRSVEWVVCDINPLEYKKQNRWKIEDEVV